MPGPRCVRGAQSACKWPLRQVTRQKLGIEMSGSGHSSLATLWSETNALH